MKHYLSVVVITTALTLCFVANIVVASSSSPEAIRRHLDQVAGNNNHKKNRLNPNTQQQNLGIYCPTNTIACNDTCCQNTTDYKAETCCPDPINGGVCCIKENTFCCKPNPALDHPSRCCPRWFVCCHVGRYGCCDPATNLPLEFFEKSPIHYDAHKELAKKTANNKARRVVGNSSSPFPDVQAIAILEETNWLDDSSLVGVTLNCTNGSWVNRTKIPRGTFRTGGEITRKFMFDREKKHSMYILQSNFTDSSLDGQVTLYKLNGLTGDVSKMVVTGTDALHEVTGYHFVSEKRTIVFATYWFEKNATTNTLSKIGYRYFTLNPDTAVAKKVSELRNPTSGPDTFAGWFHEVSEDMKTIYRLGYQDVVSSINFGLGSVNISATAAVMNPWITLPSPYDHNHFRTIHRFNPSTPDRRLLRPDLKKYMEDVKKNSNGGGDEAAAAAVVFLSLAPSTNYSNPTDLSLYVWSPTHPENSTIRLAAFPNAHTEAYFGPIGEGLSANRLKYSALVNYASPLGSTYDAWAVATVDLTSPDGIDASVESLLEPVLLSGTNSVSGFGILN